MVTKDEWNVLYTNVMPAAGILVGALGFTLGLWALLRSQSQAAGVGSRERLPVSSSLAVKIPMVHYQDGQLLVEVRNPREWHDIRDFVQPANPNVVRMVMGMSYG